MSFPLFDGTVECNKFLCFNIFDTDKKKRFVRMLYCESSMLQKISNIKDFRPHDVSDIEIFGRLKCLKMSVNEFFCVCHTSFKFR